MNMLDLHGYKKDEVFDAVDAFIMKHQNKARVKIMTGKGAGIVHKEVLKYLKQAHYSHEFEKLPSGAPNHGVLIIHIK
ncbi:MAG: Smr/MutS family protein [Bdellovibrionaceae bacterium]|jgi:DNA-nicking Smr family endonuclease|nr:Smr/MutS family protein [Pseudobdellovibrionaceae bacterium]